ncbi:MAG: HAMP domain-containing sensor histidine kinase [Pseudomonadota bacterium]
MGLEVPNTLTSLDVVFYTLTIASVAFFSFGLILTRQYHWLSYSIYGVMMIVLVAALDGSLAYLAGGDRWYMTDAPLLAGSLTAAFGFAHVAYRLEPGHWLYRAKSLNLVSAVIMAALFPAYALVPDYLPSLVPLYATLNTGMLLMWAAQIFPPMTWTQLTPAQHRFTIIWPVFTALAAVGTYAVHFIGPGFEPATLNGVNRMLFIFHLGHLLVFVCISVLEQIRARVDAERSAAEAGQAAAEAALALEISERDFEKARALASDRSRQLANASHDLKQPIATLRRVVEEHAAHDEGHHAQRLRDAIEYLDQLAGTYLSAGNEALDQSLADGEIAVDQSGRELVELNLIFETVLALFREEAQTVGVMLCARTTDIEFLVHPLALTRAVSNLVSNALAHSQGKKILLCARHKKGAVRVEIHDNGKGMAPEDLVQAMHVRQRGSNSEGSGLGLAIVEAQATEQGWQFDLKSNPGRGTSAYLTIPA